jgi:hypothetical protein
MLISWRGDDWAREMVRICPKCGFENIDQTFYCSRCGEQISKLPDTPVGSISQEDLIRSEKANAGRRLPIFVIVALVIGIIVYLVSPSDSPRISYALAFSGIWMAFNCFAILTGIWKSSPFAFPGGKEQYQVTGMMPTRVRAVSNSRSDYYPDNSPAQESVFIWGIIGFVIFLAGMLTA